MENIINVVIFQDLIDVRYYKNLLFVNKETYEIVSEIINLKCKQFEQGTMFKGAKFLDRKYFKHIKMCYYCRDAITYIKNPFNENPICKSCIKEIMINKTNAKSLFKLNENDLAMIHCCSYHITNYQIRYLYDLYTVIQLYWIKKIKKSKEDYINPPKPPRKVIRENKVRDYISKNKIEDEKKIDMIMSHNCIYSFISNGSHGIKYIRKYIEIWRNFYELIDRNPFTNLVLTDSNTQYFFDKYIDGEELILIEMKVKYDEVMFRRRRKLTIIDKLNENGIMTNFQCSHYYRFIRDKDYKLEDAFHDIREYYFFITKTEYRRIRASYLFIFNYNMDVIENKAKLKALQSINFMDIPDYIKSKYF